MITAVNHVAFGADDPQRAAADYELVFGQTPKTYTGGDGRALYRFQLDNIAFEITRTANGAAGLQRVGFEVEDMAATVRKFERRGLACDTTFSERWHDGNGSAIDRTVTPISVATTYGVAISLVETTRAGNSPAPAAPQSPVTGIDHLVVRSANPERAIALYGARLGLDFALDRTNPDWGSRLLFFRCGNVRVEIGHSLSKGISDDPDQLSGLAWRVADATQALQRLQASGVQTSDAKTGRRPGSQVLTVRSNTCNIPTIFLSETPKGDVAA
jgi:catechol 2,3-dioxygenase-like lactoylglutathione lyase family enzyme